MTKGNGGAVRVAPSFGQVAQMTLASSELFRAIRQMTPDELIRWYQQEYARHPERLAVLEAVIGVRGAML